MRRTNFALFAITAALLAGNLTACTSVPVGSVGVVVDRMAGGVEPTPLQPGVYAINPFTHSVVPMTTSRHTFVLTASTKEGGADNDEVNVNTVEGQSVSMDVALTFALAPNAAPKLYQTYHADVESIADTYVRQMIRSALQDVVGQDSVASLLGKDKERARAESQAYLTRKLSPDGIIVNNFSINAIRPPESILKAINAKIDMTQNALKEQNALQAKMYRAQGDSIEAAGEAKAIVAKAQAQAIANHELAASITPTLVEYEKAKAWDGHLPSITAGNGGFMFNVTPK